MSELVNTTMENTTVENTTVENTTVEEEFIIEPPTEFEQMELGEDEWTSLYIPVIPDNLLLQNHYDRVHKFYPKYLHGFIEKVLRIGKIRRIDFVDRQIQNSPMPVKAAFVHFEYWYNSVQSRNLREKLNTYGQFRQKGYTYKGRRCSFLTPHPDQTYRFGYFDFRINHTPIREIECDRNVHQLYAENLILEKELGKANATIVELQCQVNKMQYQLDMVFNRHEEIYRSCNDDYTPMSLAELECN